MDRLKELFKSNFSISQNSFDKLSNIAILKKYKAKDNLYEIGKTPTNIYILISGITKSYELLDNGKEYVNRFHNSGEAMGPLVALIKNIPAKSSINCITDCEIIEANYQEFIDLSESDIDIGIFTRKYLELIYLSSFKRVSEFLEFDATDRYIKLRERIPYIEKFVSQKSIASHLGITPIQLNRIKKIIN